MKDETAARVAALLDFLVWGLGHLYVGRRIGWAWLVVFGFAHAPLLLLGLAFYFTEPAGLLMLAAHLSISGILAWEVGPWMKP